MFSNISLTPSLIFDIERIQSKRGQSCYTGFAVLLLVSGLLFANISAEGDRIASKENLWLVKILKQVPPLDPETTGNDEVSSSSPCKCGINKNTTDRIVGGFLSKPNAWPWMAAIVYVRNDAPKILCGATVINSRYLLTAAHCVDYLKTNGMDKFKVYLGTNDLNDSEAIIPQIESFISHPKFDQDSKAFDVGLIKLKERLIFSSKVSPICISPQSDAPYVGRSSIVLGWGTTLFGGKTVTMQMQAMVEVVSNQACQKSYNSSEENIKVGPQMICASSPGSDSCQGDSGGPLFLQKKGMKDVFEQIGVVSFGSGCADPKFPGVYSRIGKALPWIKSVTKDATYCSS